MVEPRTEAALHESVGFEPSRGFGKRYRHRRQDYLGR